MTRIELPTERQVGHLTLLRQGRKLSLTEYNALTSNERLEMIRHATGRQKYDLILNANDAEQLTPKLHPQEIYLTINDVGTDYATELLMLTSTEQITTLLDLDCWDGDVLSPVLTLHWLELLLETGRKKVAQIAKEIEPEILVIFLKKHLTILRGLEVFDDDDVDNAKRLESIYDIDYASEDAAKVISALLKIILDSDQENYLLLMEMIRSEGVSTLEEEVFIERNNRLGDLGFIPKVEAKGIYAYRDPDRFTTGGKKNYRLEAEGLPNPTALLAAATPDNLLAEVLTNGLNHELATELCHLANRKMSADSTDISSASEIGRSLQDLYGTLNLALEHLAGTDIDKAEQIINDTYLLHLFQLGHSFVHQLQVTARQIIASPIGPFLDYPEQLFIDSLLETPVALYREATEDKPSQLQPISNAHDLQLAQFRLEQIVALQRLFCEFLPFALPATDEGEELPSLSMLFLTAIANQLLGRSLQPIPIAVEDLLLLQTKTIIKGHLSVEFSSEIHIQIEQLGLDCGFFVAFCLECWEDDFLTLDPQELSETYPASLLIKEE